MKGILISVLLILFLSAGCGGPYYYDLNLEPVTAKNKIEKILFVEDINSSHGYWTRQMVFRSNPYKVEYFTFRQWAESPGELIKNAVIKFYRNSSIFSRVVEDYSAMEPDITLKMNIYSLEMVKNKKEWYAHLALDLEFFDKKKEKVIFSHTFNRKERIRKKKPEYLAKMVSLILKEELIRIANELDGNLSE